MNGCDAARNVGNQDMDYRVDNTTRNGELTASDLAKQLLEERALHRCSCESAKTETPYRSSLSTTDGDVSLMGEVRPGDGMGGRTRHEPEETSTESGETAELSPHYHVKCSFSDTVVTFVQEPMSNGKGSFLALPISKYWRTVYKEDKPTGRCVAKAIGVMVTLLLVGVGCFLAGYFTVKSPTEESEVSRSQRGPVRIEVESALRQHYVNSYSDRRSQTYRAFSNNFTKAIDKVFVSTALNSTYSHCVVDKLRRGSIIVEFTIQLHGPPTSHVNHYNNSPEDIKTSTKETIEAILREAARSGQLASLNVDSQSIRVTRVFIGLPSQESTIAPQTSRAEWPSILKIEQGFINQRGCGIRTKSSLQARIIGGNAAEQGNWPWLGSMQYRLGSELAHRCAASILNPEWAITAAHCVDGGLGYILDHVIFGDNDLDGNSPSRQKVYIERIHVYPGYVTGKHDHDVALLKFTPRVRFDENVSPVCVETEPFEVERYDECFIAGWGNTQEYGNISAVLQEVRIPLVDGDVCVGQYREHISVSFTVITNNMICAGKDTGGADSCQSDSGGSLSCQGDDGSWRVVGLTSFGFGCGRPDFSGVYTRVSRYWDYISSAVKEEPTTHCEELVEPTCQKHLPYTSIYPVSQTDVSLFLTILPNTSYPMEINRLPNTSANPMGSNSSVLITEEDVETLMCLTMFPSCEAGGREPSVVPCREFCMEAGSGYLKGSFLPFAVSANCQRYPTGATSNDMFCRKGVNPACGITHLYPTFSNHTVINSPPLPGGYSEPSNGCTWTITGPLHMSLVIKFTRFKFPTSGLGKIIVIGSGSDAGNRSSILHKQFDSVIPDPLAIPSNEAWILFASMPDLLEEEPTESYFTIETHTAKTHTQLGDICQSGVDSCNLNDACFPSWWRCDGVRDCGGGEDETNCTSGYTI
ncbi:uncharacterized protein [Asterias amurensis]|uniref:uncharacterized protein n=1 Tax=Asterias amurensis TaxID=7602 RepID=UPI003AB7DE66